jgi:transcriptional regulator of acetoin/glycerol metabolism
VALLRALEQHEVTPVGEARPIEVDLRVVCATNRDVASLVDAGTMRQDLHARVAGLTLQIPPLRERREDFGILLGRLLSRLSRPARLSPRAVSRLLAHDWPSNIRELEKCMVTAAALAGDRPIRRSDLPEAIGQGAEPGALDDEARAIRKQLHALMTEHAGNVAAVARAMGKDRVQIHRWLKRFGLSPDRYRR